MSGGRRAVAALCALVCGCDRAPSAWDLAGLDAAFVAVVRLDPSGALVAPPVEVVRGELPVINRVADGERVYLLALDAPGLLALEPQLDLAAPGAVALVTGEGPHLDNDEDILSRALPLPGATPLFALEPGPGTRRLLAAPTTTAAALGLPGRLSLRLRRRPCAPPGLRPLEPWRPPELAPDLAGRLRGVYEVRMVRVDADRVLVLTGPRVLLVHRARPLAAPPDARGPDQLRFGPAGVQGLDLSVAVPGLWGLADIALAPTSTRADGARDLLLVAAAHQDVLDRPIRGTLAWEVEVSPAGFRRTRPVLEDDAHALDRAAVGPGGLAVLAGFDGVVRVRPAAGTAFGAPERLVPAEARGVNAAAVLDDPSHPLAVSTANRLHRLAMPELRWVSSPQVRLEPEFDLVAEAIAGDRQVWLAGYPGIALARLDGERWTQVAPLDFPSAYLACGGSTFDEAGRVRSTVNAKFKDLATGGRHLAAVVEECPALVFVRRDDACLHVLPRPSPAAGREGAFLAVEVARAPDGRYTAVVLDRGGQLWTTSWEAE